MRPDHVLTPTEAQAMLSMPPATFYRWKRAGKLPQPCARIGRTPLYSRDEILALRAANPAIAGAAGSGATHARLEHLVERSYQLMSQAVSLTDAQEVSCEVSGGARWWAASSDEEQRQQLVERLEGVQSMCVIARRTLCKDIPAQCSKTLEGTNHKA